MEGGVELHELTPQQESLEGIFMGLTQDAVQYHSHAAPCPPLQDRPPDMNAITP